VILLVQLPERQFAAGTGIGDAERLHESSDLPQCCLNVFAAEGRQGMDIGCIDYPVTRSLTRIQCRVKVRVQPPLSLLIRQFGL
jgi:hypothetical protein